MESVITSFLQHSLDNKVEFLTLCDVHTNRYEQEPPFWNGCLKNPVGGDDAKATFSTNKYILLAQFSLWPTCNPLTGAFRNGVVHAMTPRTQINSQKRDLTCWNKTWLWCPRWENMDAQTKQKFNGNRSLDVSMRWMKQTIDGASR